MIGLHTAGVLGKLYALETLEAEVSRKPVLRLFARWELGRFRFYGGDSGRKPSAC